MTTALDYLRTFTDFEQRLATVPRAAFALDRFKALLLRLGNPERGRQVVHVTGTKGKGATVHFADAVLRAHGVRTMRYSSPHVSRWNERIAIDGRDVSDDELEQLTAEARPAFEEAVQAGEPPTFFEAMTAVAFLAARAAKVDADVLEVGLGGRLDATNVCLPSATVVTSIDLDHQRLLGDTHDAIAGEKAGIVKPGAPFFCGLSDDDAGFRPLLAAATANEVRFLHVRNGIDATVTFEGRLSSGRLGVRFDGQVGDIALKAVEAPGGGPHQAINVLLAVGAAAEVLSRLGRRFDRRAAAIAIAETSLPARAEVFGSGPLWYLDGAHTQRSVEAAARLFRAGYPDLRPVLLAASTEERDPGALFGALATYVKDAVFVPIASPRTADPAHILRAFRAAGGQGTTATDSLSGMIVAAEKAGADGAVLVLGSFYLAGEARAKLLSEA